MLSCWHEEEHQRPSFTALKSSLLGLLPKVKNPGDDAVVGEGLQEMDYIPMGSIKTKGH